MGCVCSSGKEPFYDDEGFYRGKDWPEDPDELSKALEIHQSDDARKATQKKGKDPKAKTQILLKNKSDKEVLVYAVADPDALRLKEKIVKNEAGAHVKAEAYGVGGGVEGKKGSEIRYEAVGNGIGVQKDRIKRGHQIRIKVDGPTYIAVIFYADGLYHFAIESRLIENGSCFTISKHDLETEIPFKTSTAEPNYGSMMEQ